MANLRPAMFRQTSIPHVMPANAGPHSDATNHGPGGSGLVDRRIKCADDVGGALGGAETGNVDYAMTGNWALAQTALPNWSGIQMTGASD